MKRTRFGALLVAAGLLVAACTGGSASPTAGEPSAPPASGEAPSAAPSEAGQPKPGGTLVAAIPGDISRTDPALVDDANSSYVMTQVMEGLVGLAPGSATEIMPVLAMVLAIVLTPLLSAGAPLRNRRSQQRRPSFTSPPARTTAPEPKARSQSPTSTSQT